MKRYLSLDILRGISIFGMVFSAIVPAGVLPAWMYHAQNPPPTHDLNVLVQGITWVDMVFPIFIFCMGAAIPLAGNRKIEQWKETRLDKKQMALRYVKETFSRFFMLWAFSYLYVFTSYTNIQSIWAQLLTIAGFASFFPFYMVLPKHFSSRKKNVIRITGAICLLAVCLTGHFCFGEVISLHRRGIIIFLLAFLYLFGSLIWYFLRKQRVWVFLVLLAFTVVTQKLNLPAITYGNPSVNWWFNMEYFYFLLLLIPATYVGEGITVKQKFIMMGVLILLGCAAMPFTGGITKVPCTVAYCMITCAISLAMLMLLDLLCKVSENNLFTWIFAGAGKNPLMSYIAFDSFIVPIMNITALIKVYQWGRPEAHPWIGVLTSAIAVIITMSLTALCSKKKIIWKA